MVGGDRARNVLTRNSWRVVTGQTTNNKTKDIPIDFSSDVGRKCFGFSHEELNGSPAYYEGQFKVGQRSGTGTMHNPESGARYVGEFQADRFHGEGEQVWSDSSRFAGQWVKGQKHGYGRFVDSQNLVYAGKWEHSRRHGDGTQEFANGDVYSGCWYEGFCDGIGTYSFADGSQYEGIWSQGRYDGMGILYGNDGSRERHTYNAGILVKREILPAGAPVRAGRRNTVGHKVLFDQRRDEMHTHTKLPAVKVSQHLIKRDMIDADLSAPPLTKPPVVS